ncbi:MAG: Bug family tripartite tricarboxylate transporter substrate binding protein [Lautropia sp.]
MIMTLFRNAACAFAALLAGVLLGVVPADGARAQGSDRTTRLVVGYAPGGGTDLVARLLAARISEDTGHAMVVENRPGGSGVVAASQVARAAPDGTTLMMGVVSLNAIQPHLAAMPYDPLTAFAPVTLTASVPHIVVVHPSLPVKTLPELIAYLKANPDKGSFPSAGNGTTPHIAGEMFKHMAGVQMLHVPYKSSGQSIPDLVSGRLTVGFDTYPAAAPLVRAGQLRPIAVTSTTRLKEFPDLPTVAESGLPDYRFSTWYGIFAPAGTTEAVVSRVHADFARAMKNPNVHAKLVEMGIDETETRTPADFARLVESDLARFARIVKDANIRIER